MAQSNPNQNNQSLPGMEDQSTAVSTPDDISLRIAAAVTDRPAIDHQRKFSEAALDQGIRPFEPHIPMSPNTSNDPINGDLPHETPLSNPLIRFVKSTMERRREFSAGRERALKVVGEIAVNNVMKEADGDPVRQAALIKARETHGQAHFSDGLPAAIAPFFSAADNTRNGK